ncbi:MAG: S10 family peptidase [Akkermansiaceae bacterium]
MKKTIRLPQVYALTAGVCLTIFASPMAYSEDKKADKDKKSAESKKDKPKTVVKYGNITIDGEKVTYKVTTSRLVLKTDDGTPRASIFNVAYTREGVGDMSKRPVLFAFNGGPGSSAVWLHLGALGPKIVPTSPDGTKPIAPPLSVKDNPQSILDVADLVFIDPVSTGYSRSENKKENFHGLDQDIRSVGDFIRRWVTDNKRWSSPKYLLGESYGGVRAAGLSMELQNRYGMSLNGVVLLSSLMDFRTLRPSVGNDLSYIAYLPAMTAVAYHHGKLQGDREALIKKSQEFASGAYATALLKGYALGKAERENIAKELSALTALPASLILQYDLRINSSRFRKELLRDQGKVIGRFDARVAWPVQEKASDTPYYDPSFSVAKGAFSTAMLGYLGDGLGWVDEKPYEIIANVHPWDWGKKNDIVNTSSRLAVAMRDNPHLRVLVQCGHTDLATPPGGVLHSIAHMKIPEPQRENIIVKWYDAGHMFYLNEPDLKKMRKDLVEFIK